MNNPDNAKKVQKAAEESSQTHTGVLACGKSVIGGAGPAGIRVYRGGSDLTPSARDVTPDPVTGLLKPTKGISLNCNPDSPKLAKFGGPREIESIPEELQIKQRGQDLEHYELMPKQPMTMEHFKYLLSKVKLR